LRDGLVDFGLGAAGGYAAEDLSVGEDGEASLIGEKSG
jgi:hypothetical protein